MIRGIDELLLAPTREKRIINRFRRLIPPKGPFASRFFQLISRLLSCIIIS